MNPSATLDRTGTLGNNAIYGTKSSILRQEAILKKKIEDENKIMKAFESEKRDLANYMYWVDEQRQKAEEDRFREIEKRKLENKLVSEYVAEARQEKMEENQKIVALMRKEKEEIERMKSIQKEKEERNKKSISQDVRANREAAKLAKLEVLKNRKIEAEEVNKTSQKLREQQERNETQEKAKREDIIRQIRALERVPNRKSPKTLDLCEIADSSFINSMSIVELRARLQLLKEEEQVYLEEKRKEIEATRVRKRQQLEEKSEYVLQLRQQAQLEAEKRRLQQKEENEEKARREKELKDQEILSLHSKLEAKKAARQSYVNKLKQESAENKKKYEAISGDALALEWKRFEEQELGEERAIRERQEALKLAANSQLEIKKKQEKMNKKKTKPPKQVPKVESSTNDEVLPSENTALPVTQATN